MAYSRVERHGLVFGNLGWRFRGTRVQDLGLWSRVSSRVGCGFRGGLALGAGLWVEWV